MKNHAPTQILNFSKDASTFDYSDIHLDDPPRFYPYAFEVFDWKWWCEYFSLNPHFCLIAASLYIVTIFGLKNYMKDREAFELKTPLFLWNAALGLFSIVGFIRTAPEFFSILLEENGLYRSICMRNGGNMPLAYWSLLFVLSKYVELGDTVFIVLRKRPLVFIQWYHHVMTLIMCWITAPYIEPISRYYVFNVSIFCSPCTGLLHPTKDFQHHNNVSDTGIDCHRHNVSMRLSFLVYGSFTLLFGKLFVDVLAKSRMTAKAKAS